MKIYIINRINKDSESALPYSNPYKNGFTDKNEAKKMLSILPHEEVTVLNECSGNDKDCKAGYWYGITSNNWVALFDKNENPIKYITRYTLNEIAIGE